MDIKRCTKESFAVIGREGSTLDGKNLIQKLWDDVDSHFNEISDLALKDINGNIVGRWGLTSDFNHNLKPWEENYRRGLYLAGVECNRPLLLRVARRVVDHILVNDEMAVDTSAVTDDEIIAAVSSETEG